MSYMGEIVAADAYADEDDGAPALSAGTRRAYQAIGGLFAALALAAALVPVGGAVIAQGQVGAETRVKRVAHPGGGVVGQIMVREGDRVRRGQVLVRLDTAVAAANAASSGQTVDQLTAQRARLLAEREGSATIAFPPDLLARTDASAIQAMAAERKMLALHAAERQGQRAQLAERIRQLNQQAAGYRAQIAATAKQKTLIAPERAGLKTLYDKGLVTMNRLNQLERTAIDMDGTIGSLRASIAQIAAHVAETREQMIGLDQAARTAAATELTQVTATLADQQARTAGAADAVGRGEIRSPAEGVVDKLNVAAAGSVVQPAETILEIVPTGDRLVVEGAISPADIDRVRVGQAARVRFAAFSAQTTPEIAGTVVFVSPERTLNKDTGASFYRIRVRLDARQVAAERLALKAGMPADVFVTTGSRSMLSYLTKPLRDQFARAFRD
jgi:HlyD family type I secretion membrane fusion protein